MHRRPAVVERAPDPVQLALVELPHEYAVDIAAEGDLGNRNVDMLAMAMHSAGIVRRHGARRRDHIGMEGTGVARLLDRRPVRLPRTEVLAKPGSLVRGLIRKQKNLTTKSTKLLAKTRR